MILISCPGLASRWHAGRVGSPGLELDFCFSLRSSWGKSSRYDLCVYLCCHLFLQKGGSWPTINRQEVHGIFSRHPLGPGQDAREHPPAVVYDEDGSWMTMRTSSAGITDGVEYLRISEVSIGSFKSLEVFWLVTATVQGCFQNVDGTLDLFSRSLKVFLFWRRIFHGKPKASAALIPTASLRSLAPSPVSAWKRCRESQCEDRFSGYSGYEFMNLQMGYTVVYTLWSWAVQIRVYDIYIYICIYIYRHTCM